jgi:hypothetical protein
MTQQQKKCFIITPIGKDGTDIRRHIDGVIDEVIEPVLKGKYEITVAHRSFESVNITKSLMADIYTADLVIANLTNLNPNVMYELAFRHALGTPVICIAAEGTDLPFDVSDMRTFFYRNDFRGALELKAILVEAVVAVEQGVPTDNPIFSAIGEADIKEKLLKNPDALNGDPSAVEFILDKLTRIERKVSDIERTTKKANPKRTYTRDGIDGYDRYSIKIQHIDDMLDFNERLDMFKRELLNSNPEIIIRKVRISEESIELELHAPTNFINPYESLRDMINESLKSIDIDVDPEFILVNLYILT